MKTKTFFLILLMFLAFKNNAVSQNPQWINYTNGDLITANEIEINGNDTTFWLGTSGGLVEIKSENDSVIYHNRANSGLPLNNITCLAIDTNNCKWIGTLAGLAKFDGEVWEVYTTENSGLPLKEITALGIDKTGLLWITSYYDYGGGQASALSTFDLTTWQTHLFSPTIGRTKRILADHENHIWFSGVGLNHYYNGNLITYNESNSPLPNNDILNMEFDNNGDLWIGTWDGVNNSGDLAKFDGQNWEIYNALNSGLPNNDVYCFAFEENNYWFGTNNGLAKFDGSNWEVLNTSNSEIQNNQLRTLKFLNNKLLIGTANGFSKFTGDSWTFYETSISGLPDNRVQAITKEDNGTLWIGTYSGLVKFKNNEWTVYKSVNSELPTNSILSLAVDLDGSLWVGTSGGGLVHIEDQNWTIYNTANSELPHNSVLALAVDHDGNKWIGTWQSGVMKFDGTTWTNYYGNGLVSIHDFAVDNNNVVWVGASSKLGKFDGTNWTMYNTGNSGLYVDDIDAITCDNGNNVWIGSTDMLNMGLIKFDGNNNWTYYNTWNSGLPSYKISTLFTDHDNNIWIGTEYGLAKFDGINWETFNLSNSGIVSNDSFTDLYVDNWNNAYIGATNKGIAVYNAEGIITTIPTDNKNALSFNVYPNPARNKITISNNTAIPHSQTISIYQLSGQLVLQQNTQNSKLIEIDISTLPKGIYLLKIQSHDKTEFKKLIKQ